MSSTSGWTGEPASVSTQRRTAASAPRSEVTVHGPTCEGCGQDAANADLENGTRLCPRCRRIHAVIAAVHLLVSISAMVVLLFDWMPHLIATQTTAHLIAQEGFEGPRVRPLPRLLGGEILVFYLALAFAIPIHEGAHALCARALGFTVTEVHIGSGRVVLLRKLMGTLVAVHAVPLGGLTRWRGGPARLTPGKRAAVAFAGPLSNLAVAGVCLLVRADAPYLAIPAACANLLMFIDNFTPSPYSPWGGRIPNDGWQILGNITKSRWATNSSRLITLSGDCFALVRAGRRPEAVQRLRGEIDAADGDYPDAEALLCALLLSPRHDESEIDEGLRRSRRLLWDQRAFPPLRALALNNRAWLIAVRGWHVCMADAEWSAKEALRGSPENVSIRGTLALILVRLGHLDSAETLANEVLQQRIQLAQAAEADPRQQQAKQLAANHCTLALLRAAKQQYQAAEQELAQARSLDASAELLPELERVLAAGARAAPATSPA